MSIIQTAATSLAAAARSLLVQHKYSNGYIYVGDSEIGEANMVLHAAASLLRSGLHVWAESPFKTHDSNQCKHLDLLVDLTPTDPNVSTLLTIEAKRIAAGESDGKIQEIINDYGRIRFWRKLEPAIPRSQRNRLRRRFDTTQRSLPNLTYQSAMSLSTFVERKDVKEYLRLNVPKPWFQVRAEIKAPPLTTSYGWTGTAFDYAMRFYLQKLNPSATVRRWLAEESAAMVVASRRETARTKKRVLGIVETAKDCVRSYTKSRRDAKPGAELIRAAVDLAQLDLVYRIGLLDLQPINAAMIEDIGNMLAIVRPEDFRAKKTCVLNPTFGEASLLVGGADGDLFIDGTLGDIKVNKNLELGSDIFNQLLGYFCLSCIGGVDGCRSKVTCVGVYFARYGILHRMPINSFIQARCLPAHLRWFKAIANRGISSKNG
jgi:hypothetical protein